MFPQVLPSPLALVTLGAVVTLPVLQAPLPRALLPVRTSPMLPRVLLLQLTLPLSLLEPILPLRPLELMFPPKRLLSQPILLPRLPELMLPPTVVALTDQDPAPRDRLLLPLLSLLPSSLPLSSPLLSNPPLSSLPLLLLATT